MISSQKKKRETTVAEELINVKKKRKITFNLHVILWQE